MAEAVQFAVYENGVVMNTRFATWDEIEHFELTPITRGHRHYGLFAGKSYELKMKTIKKTFATFNWIIPAEQKENLEEAIEGKASIEVKKA